MNPQNVTLRLLLISLIVLAAPTLTADVAQAQNRSAQNGSARKKATKPQTGKPPTVPAKAAKRTAVRQRTQQQRDVKKVIQVGGGAKQAVPKRVTYKQGRDLLYDIQQRSNTIHRQLRDARTKHNAKRVKCLDAKLTQIHTLERVAGREVLALRGAVRSKQDHIAQWRMMRLRIMALRGAELSSEATGCGASIRRGNQRAARSRVRVIRRPSLPRYYDMPHWARQKRRQPVNRARKTARKRTPRRR